MAQALREEVNGDVVTLPRSAPLVSAARRHGTAERHPAGRHQLGHGQTVRTGG